MTRVESLASIELTVKKSRSQLKNSTQNSFNSFMRFTVIDKVIINLSPKQMKYLLSEPPFPHVHTHTKKLLFAWRHNSLNKKFTGVTWVSSRAQIEWIMFWKMRKIRIRFSWLCVMWFISPRNSPLTYIISLSFLIFDTANEIFMFFFSLQNTLNSINESTQ